MEYRNKDANALQVVAIRSKTAAVDFRGRTMKDDTMVVQEVFTTVEAVQEHRFQCVSRAERLVVGLMLEARIEIAHKRTCVLVQKSFCPGACVNYFETGSRHLQTHHTHLQTTFMKHPCAIARAMPVPRMQFAQATGSEAQRRSKPDTTTGTGRLSRLAHTPGSVVSLVADIGYRRWCFSFLVQRQCVGFCCRPVARAQRA